MINPLNIRLSFRIKSVAHHRNCIFRQPAVLFPKVCQNSRQAVHSSNKKKLSHNLNASLEWLRISVAKRNLLQSAKAYQRYSKYCVSTKHSSTPNSNYILKQFCLLGLNILKTSREELSPFIVQQLCRAGSQCSQWRLVLATAPFLFPQEPHSHFLSKLFNGENYNTIIKKCHDRGWYWDPLVAIEQLRRQGNWEKALQVALLAEKPYNNTRMPVERFSAIFLLPLLASKTSWKNAIGLFRHFIAEGNLVSSTLLEMILTQVGKSSWETCLYLASDVQRFCWDVDLSLYSSDFYPNLISLCPQWEASMSLLHHMWYENIPLDKKIIISVLTRCNAAHAWSASLILYGFLYKKKHISKSEITFFTRFIHFSRLLSKWETGVSILSSTNNVNSELSSIYLCECIEKHEKQGTWDIAIRLGRHFFKELRISHDSHIQQKTESNRVLSGSFQNKRNNNNNLLLAPHFSLSISRAYQSLFAAMMQGRRWEESIILFNNMLSEPQFQPTNLMAEMVLSTCAATHQWESALRLWEIICKKPGIAQPSQSLALIARACIYAQQWSRVLKITEYIRMKKIPMNNHLWRTSLWASSLCKILQSNSSTLS